MKLNIKSLILFLLGMYGFCCAPLSEVSAGKPVKRHGHRNAVSLFVPSTVDVVDSEGKTSLHRCAENGELTSVRQLINNMHADVSKRDNRGMTPLHHAAKNGRSVTVRWLLREGGAAKHINVKDKYGRTALYYAASLPNPDTARYLVEYGADLNLVDKLGKKPNEYARWLDLLAMQSDVMARRERAALAVFERDVRTVASLSAIGSDVVKVVRPDADDAEIGSDGLSLPRPQAKRRRYPSEGLSSCVTHGSLPVVFVRSGRSEPSVSHVVPSGDQATDSAAPLSTDSSALRTQGNGDGIEAARQTSPAESVGGHYVEAPSAVLPVVTAGDAPAVAEYMTPDLSAMPSEYPQESEGLFAHDDGAPTFDGVPFYSFVDTFGSLDAPDVLGASDVYPYDHDGDPYGSVTPNWPFSEHQDF